MWSLRLRSKVKSMPLRLHSWFPGPEGQSQAPQPSYRMLGEKTSEIGSSEWVQINIKNFEIHMETCYSRRFLKYIMHMKKKFQQSYHITGRQWTSQTQSNEISGPGVSYLFCNCCTWSSHRYSNTTNITIALGYPSEFE